MSASTKQEAMVYAFSTSRKALPPKARVGATRKSGYNLIDGVRLSFQNSLRRHSTIQRLQPAIFAALKYSRYHFQKSFSKPVDFRDSQFDFVSCDGVEFLAYVDFTGCKFRNVASFSCTFRAAADFTQTEFIGPALFHGAKFSVSAVFWGARLKSPWFKGATFSNVDFSMAEIEGNAAFDESTFHSDARFSYVKFKGDSSFSKVVFESSITFQSSVFGSAADFDETQFKRATDFSSTTFLGRVRFRRSLLNDASFRLLDVGKEADVVFESMSLGESSFLDTNLEQLRFRDVTWHRQKGQSVFDRNRASLRDEFRTLSKVEKGDFERIAENYRQLVLVYERKRDFETAEDFHIGEMEMRRKKKGREAKHSSVRMLRGWLNSYGVYRILSNYGTNYIQALGVLVMFFCLFSLAFLYSGFHTTTESPQRTIEYNVLANSSHDQVSTSEWIADYVSAMSLCATIITFQKDRFYEPLPGVSRLWLFLAVIGLTGQVAMTLLALRRRFRR